MEPPSPSSKSIVEWVLAAFDCKSWPWDVSWSMCLSSMNLTVTWELVPSSRGSLWDHWPGTSQLWGLRHGLLVPFGLF